MDRNYSDSTGNSRERMSLPARERGSKLRSRAAIIKMRSVAPRAGAWIETLCRSQAPTGQPVAPRAGAWIETVRPAKAVFGVPGRSPRGSVDRNAAISTLHTALHASLPARERGSKLRKLLKRREIGLVAPRAGAWIETP